MRFCRPKRFFVNTTYSTVRQANEMIMLLKTKSQVSFVTRLVRFIIAVLVSCHMPQMTKAWSSPPPNVDAGTTQEASPCTRLSQRSTRLYSSFFGISDDTGGDPVVRLPLMEAELATLVMVGSGDNDKNHDAVAVLETAIRDAKTAAEFGVRAAQLSFYEAFSAGDFQAMDRLWSTESHVRVVHPGMSSMEGREAVMSSWKQILASTTAGTEDFRIKPSRTQVEICGLVAICSCIETTSKGRGNLEAVNIYKREGGAWRMILHQAGPILVT